MAEIQHGHIGRILAVLHYSLPCLIFVYYVASSVISACTLRSTALKAKDQHVRRDVLLWLMFGLTATYALQTGNVFLHALLHKGAESDASQDSNVFLIASMIVWSVQTLAVFESEFPVWYPYYGSWAVGLVSQIFMTIEFQIYVPQRDVFTITTTVIGYLRVSVFLALFSVFLGLRNRQEDYEDIDAEQQGLLTSVHDNNPRYGTAVKAQKEPDKKKLTENDDVESDAEAEIIRRVREDEDRMLRRLRQDGSFWAYLRGFRVFLPHMLPFHDKLLMFRGVLVIFCLLASNFINVLIPRQFGIIVDLLGQHDHRSIWIAAITYAGLTFLGQGLISWLRYWLWLPIEQFGQQSLIIAAHSHVMNLSCEFHDSKESFEIHQAVNQGQHVTGIVETICFEIVPMLVDLCLATAYLYWLFGPYLSLTVACTALAYIYTTSKLVSMANDKRRMSNALFRRQWSTGYRSIDTWVTATLFNNLQHEQDKYANSVGQRMNASWSYGMATRLITVAQAFVMTTGLLAAMTLAIYQVLYGTKSTGDFSALFMYWSQLRAPLSYFSRVYKDLSSNMMDAERLLELFQTKPTVTDKPGAEALQLKSGDIRFENVSHTYDERSHGLQNIDFHVPGGHTVAFVGETGGGKSTIMKLLNRFYDVSNGDITIDGQNICDITLSSLRAAIGVVPQDPAIFDGTIFANVIYGRLGSTLEEVQNACRAAAVHDKIMSFPDGYFSKVGRRGVKLSGGEKQRLAIARTMLKNPPIIILDEATSALDTDTEQSIQEALNSLSEGRTTLVVAHRLSTILNADRIMVVMGGQIVESGTHEGLISNSRGKYHDLWKKQISANKRVNKSDADNKNLQTSAFPLSRQVRDILHSDLLRGSTTPPQQVQTSDTHPQNNNKAVNSPLQPDAPEFFPRGLLSRASIDRYSSGSESKTNKKLAKEAKKAEEKRKKEEKASLKALRKSRGQVDGSEDFDAIVPGKLNATGIQSEVPSKGPTRERKIQFRKPIHSRKRLQSKSEPFARGEESGEWTASEDTINNSEGDAISSKEHKYRRVTAPTSGLRGRQRGRTLRVKGRNDDAHVAASDSNSVDAESSEDANGSTAINSERSSSEEHEYSKTPTSTPVAGIKTNEDRHGL